MKITMQATHVDMRITNLDQAFSDTVRRADAKCNAYMLMAERLERKVHRFDVLITRLNRLHARFVRENARVFDEFKTLCDQDFAMFMENYDVRRVLTH